MGAGYGWEVSSRRGVQKRFGRLSKESAFRDTAAAQVGCDLMYACEPTRLLRASAGTSPSSDDLAGKAEVDRWTMNIILIN
jgi:hypothetical protein